MNKKLLIGIGVVLGIVALGVAAYFAWQNRAKIVEVIPAITGGGVIPAVKPAEQRLKQISSHQVMTYWVSKTASSSDIFYIDENNTNFKIGSDGVETSDTLDLKKFVSVTPSPAGDLLYMRTSNEGDASIYDTTKSIMTQSFIGVDSIAWGPESGKIARLVSGTDAGPITPQVVVEDIKDAKSQSKIVAKFGLEGFDLQWAQKGQILLTQRPSADYVSDMWKVDLNTGKLQKFLSGHGLMVSWTPFGDRGLEFTTNDGRAHKLSIIDGNGNRLKDLRFVTLPNKCTMVTSSQMYCAIPRDQESLTHMTLPDDYLKRSVYTKDGIYQIDIDKDSIRGIFEDENPDIDAVDLKMVDNNKLLFINRYDRKLYSLDLQ